MSEERRSDGPTRRMLRIFGVTVSNYEEKTARLLQGGLETMSPADLAGLAAETMALTAELDRVLREMNNHVLEMEARVLGEMKAALERARAT